VEASTLLLVDDLVCPDLFQTPLPPYFKAKKFHSFKLAAMEEEFFPILCLDKPKTTVYDLSDCAL
jgi:hypothetical protein